MSQEITVFTPDECARNIINWGPADERVTGRIEVECQNPASLGACPVVVTVLFENSTIGRTLNYTNGEGCPLMQTTKDKDTPPIAKIVNRQGRRNRWWR